MPKHRYGHALLLMRGKEKQLLWAIEDKDSVRIASCRQALHEAIDDLRKQVDLVRAEPIRDLSWYPLFKQTEDEIEHALALGEDEE